MSLPQIIALLRQTVGLDVASVGVHLIERAVKRRIDVNDLRNISQYADLIQRSEPELQSLFEAVAVPETFFFRYPESFAALRQIVADQYLFGSQKMRVLSVPCSTGEEPYSIAMTLLDAGLSWEKFHIDAVDINAHSLTIAKLGMFGSNSFRGSELQYRNQYFRKANAGFRICDRVRQCVKFEQGNILEERFRFGDEPYDFIFCRNLLIYFFAEAQDQAIKSLRQLLTADGLLFVGAAETSLLTQRYLSSVQLPMAFAFRKSALVPPPSLPKLKQPKVSPHTKKCRTEASRKPKPAIAKKVEPQTAIYEETLVRDLAFAELLADKGELEEAAEICAISLREQGPSARAFHLLGLICDSSGDQHQASEFYRKALYLEPDHYEVMIHLALLKDKSGDNAAAKTLKNRAHRILERTK
jgi:chemotaxis protein methyltransferase WspC